MVADSQSRSTKIYSVVRLLANTMEGSMRRRRCGRRCHHCSKYAFCVCSLNCTEDYLAVYDGPTSSWPLIGRFCGRHGAHLIADADWSILTSLWPLIGRFCDRHGAHLIAAADWSILTSSWPLIGRFCGRHGAHLVSSGTSLFVVFHSAPRRATSFNHSGFALQVVDRWKSKTTC